MIQPHFNSFYHSCQTYAIQALNHFSKQSTVIKVALGAILLSPLAFFYCRQNAPSLSFSGKKIPSLSSFSNKVSKDTYVLEKNTDKSGLALSVDTSEFNWSELPAGTNYWLNKLTLESDAESFSFPEGLKFPNLSSIYSYQANIESLPLPKASELKNLRELHIEIVGSLKSACFPPEAPLNSLESVVCNCVWDLETFSFPEEADLSALVELNFSDSQRFSTLKLPKGSSLKSLKTVNLAKTGIQSLDFFGNRGVQDLPSLELLDLSGCSMLRSLPDWITSLPQKVTVKLIGAALPAKVLNQLRRDISADKYCGPTFVLS